VRYDCFKQYNSRDRVGNKCAFTTAKHVVSVLVYGDHSEFVNTESYYYDKYVFFSFFISTFARSVVKIKIKIHRHLERVGNLWVPIWRAPRNIHRILRPRTVHWAFLISNKRVGLTRAEMCVYIYIFSSSFFLPFFFLFFFSILLCQVSPPRCTHSNTHYIIP